MRMLLIVLGALLAIYIAYSGVKFYLTVQVSKKLIHTTVPYEKPGEEGARVLVLGDSTAVGVGSDSPEESLAGRVSTYLNAGSVENYAKSGARAKDLQGQIVNAKYGSYQLILIQIGGNDIIRFTGSDAAANELRNAIALLPEAEKIVIISAGDVGGATLFPAPVRPFHTKLNNEYHAAFEKVANETSTTYVNFGSSPATKVINEHPELYLAKDGLHPSSAGYALWFDAIRSSL